MAMSQFILMSSKGEIFRYVELQNWGTVPGETAFPLLSDPAPSFICVKPSVVFWMENYILTMEFLKTYCCHALADRGLFFRSSQ